MKLFPSLSTSLILVLCSATLTFSPSLYAQQWWFDVEVIVFKRLESAEALDENFGSWKAIDKTSSIDLFTPYLFPKVDSVRASLPLCYPQEEAPPSLDALNQSLSELENSRSVNEYESLFENDEVTLSDQQTSDDDLNATDDLFLQFEQSQQDPQDDFFTDLSDNALDNEVTQAAFKALLLAADNDIDWVDLTPLDSMACQFEQETRYLADLITPFTLQPKLVRQTPRYIDPAYQNYNGQPYLLPQENFQLTPMARDLNRQRGVRLISHMLWRQEVVFGRNKAPSFRLLAGQNYGTEYQIDGQRHPTSEQQTSDDLTDNSSAADDTSDLLSQVSAIIEQDEPSKPLEQILFESEISSMQKGYAEQQSLSSEEALYDYPSVWEVDGLFKVYLQRLGQTPYLHIDSQLNYRQPGKLPMNSELALFNTVDANLDKDPTAFLHSYHFQQLRRIISKQIHYFDHPAFGLIIQLRRYHPPALDEE